MLNTADEFPGTPKYYRQKAQELFLKAESAASEKDRFAYLTMAGHWQRLAQSVEEARW